MKINVIDPEIARKMAFEATVPIYLKIPKSLLNRIDDKASGEMINRAAWIRRTLLAATSEARKND